MKKIISVILAIIMIMSFASIAFAANPIIAAGGSDSVEVKGAYRAGSSADTIYNVEITWGSLEYTYTGAGQGTWNPDSHSYSGGSAAKWSCATNADKITVKNHSNADIKAVLSYTAKDGYSAINGTFTESSGIANDGVLNLATAVATDVLEAPSADVNLALAGDLSSGITNQPIATITVTLE